MDRIYYRWYYRPSLARLLAQHRADVPRHLAAVADLHPSLSVRESAWDLDLRIWLLKRKPWIPSTALRWWQRRIAELPQLVGETDDGWLDQAEAVLVAWAAGQPVGMVGVVAKMTPAELQYLPCMIRREARCLVAAENHQGIGSGLMRRVIRYAHRRGEVPLLAVTTDEKAAALFDKLGAWIKPPLIDHQNQLACWCGPRSARCSECPFKHWENAYWWPTHNISRDVGWCQRWEIGSARGM
jgi:GNAT superfamily N-acetyltransferase